MRVGDWLGVGGLCIGLATICATVSAEAESDAAETSEARIGPSAASEGLWCFRPDRRADQAAFERALGDAIEAGTLREFHDALAAEPHPAASEGDRRTIEYIAGEFERMGLDVETHWIDVYLAKPVAGEVEIVQRDGQPVSVGLPTMEEAVDEFSADPTLDFGWNAFSGSGDVEAEVVYANFGTLNDFRRLAELGIDCTGKIVIARYGGNYRGYKAKFAEEAGAVGLIIYSDPENVGYVRGLMYPEGGWANATQIQRGSIKTLPYAGDPLTPGEPAIDGTARLDPETLALPRIPVQPVGWIAAQPILEAMRGEVVPEEWQGGLPLNYRLTGGKGLRVRLKVEQVRGIMRTANVVGTLKGREFPEQRIVIGCHHDAWTHGAGDPTAGLNVVMELARTFGELASRGHRPDRSISFAAWGAEEYGIIGSTEWVEQHAADLASNCVAYLNLDMAAMGVNFGASASPLLKNLIVDATRDVEQVDNPGTSVHGAWDRRDEGRTPEQQIGSLGGGSDHLGFNCHIGVPCMSMGVGGSRGVSYHSAYDNLAWYRKVVGDDYEPAAMITRVAQIAAARLANADVLPFDLESFGESFTNDVRFLETRASALDMTVPQAEQLLDAGTAFQSTGAEFRDLVDRVLSDPERFDIKVAVGGTVVPNGHYLMLNSTLMSFRNWWARDKAGLLGRPWYRNQLVATDPYSGYGSWSLPDLRWYLEESRLGGHEREQELRGEVEARARILAISLDTLGAQFQILRDRILATQPRDARE